MAMAMANFDGTDDFFDSREVIERIQELKDEFTEATGDNGDDYAMSEDDWSTGLNEDGAAQLVALLKLQDEAAACIPDWHYGEAFIHEDYFVEYVRELLADAGYLPADLPGWIIIDWDETADNVKQDYTEFEFMGSTYYAR